MKTRKKKLTSWELAKFEQEQAQRARVRRMIGTHMLQGMLAVSILQEMNV